MIGGMGMITLQQLQYFKELAQSGHLTRTAQKLYITQATLSNVIANLEKQLGVKLFDRVGRNLQLSPIGKAYLEDVTQALEILQKGQEKIDSYRQAAEEKVSVAFNNTIVWTGLIRDFQNRHRNYSIRQINCSDPDRSREMLLDMDVDYVIAGTTDFSLDKLEYQILRDEQVCLCVPLNHPLAGKESVHLQELQTERFINAPGAHPFQKFCNDLLEQAGIQLDIALECDYMMCGQLIEAGLGVGLSTRSAYQSKVELGMQLASIPIADPIPSRSIALIWNPKRNMTRAAQDFREFTIARESRPQV